MSLGIHLLGKPRLERDGEPAPSPRGRKAWGLLAYLALSRVRNPSRERLAELLFVGADDPPDAYVWVQAFALGELAAAAVEAGHRHAREWVEDLSALAARTGMRELGVRACLLRAALGDQRSLDSAAALVGEVENPALRERVQGLRATATISSSGLLLRGVRSG